MSRVKELKRELAGAAVCVAMSAIALGSATYAWYVSNNRVDATTSTISATTNGFVLQIDSLENGVQHGGNNKSLEAFSDGSTLSPSSTNDLTNWYVCDSWNGLGNVTSYSKPEFISSPKTKPGNYKGADGKDYYAYIRSDYVLYTMTATGKADVYFADDGIESPITITSKSGDVVKAVSGSMRVAVTTQKLAADGKTVVGPETLAAVYAFDDVAGTGNDESAVAGWSNIQNIDGVAKPAGATYLHMSGNKFIDQNGDEWAAAKDTDDNYSAPTDKPRPLIKNLGYNGMAVHIYIWMEGTDADCVNGKSIEDNDTTYDVTVRFAGVSS